MKLSTGDNKLNALMDGGFGIKDNILVVSPPGEIKKIFSLQFIREGLYRDETCIIINYDTPTNELKAYFEEMIKGKRPIIIDGYSWSLGTVSNSRYNVQGPNALNDLSILLSRILEKHKGQKRVLFNSLSTVLLYNDPETVYKFVQIIGARLKDNNCATMFLMESGMHSDEVMATIEHTMDEVVSFTQENKTWKMRIKSLENFPITVEFSSEGVAIP